MAKKNTSSSLVNAANDTDLQARAIALAAEMGIDMPQSFVGNRMLQLVSQEVGTDTSIASAYEYAANVQKENVAKAKKAYDDALATEKPGKNPGAVTDEHIRTALTKLKAQVFPPTTI